MKFLYKNATIITQNESREVLEQGYVVVIDGYISEIGTKSPVGTFDEILDLEGKWLLPGFVNSHVHLGESIYFPFINEKLNLSSYLVKTERIFASNIEIENKRDVVCKFSLYQHIQNGVTAVGGGRVSKTATELSMPNMSGYMLMNSAKLGHFSKNASENFLQIKSQEKNPLNRHCIFIHSLSRIGKEEIEAVKRLKNDLDDLIVMIHVNEDELECIEVKRMWGASSIEVLNDNGILDSKSFLIHGNHLSDSDLDIISGARATICHCITSNLTVADKVLDITRVLDRNINLVIATDGPITGAGFNILSEARKVYQYQNRFLEKEKVSPQQCLDMITINAANAIGLGKNSGSVEVGKLANFVIFEPPFEVEARKAVNMLIRYELVDVFGVVINGYKLVWNKELAKEDWLKTKSEFSSLVKAI